MQNHTKLQGTTGSLSSALLIKFNTPVVMHQIPESLMVLNQSNTSYISLYECRLKGSQPQLKIDIDCKIILTYNNHRMPCNFINHI